MRTLSKLLAITLVAVLALGSVAFAAVEEKDSAFVPTEVKEYTYWYMNDADIPSIETPYQNIPGDWLEEVTKVVITEGFGNGGLQPAAKLATMIAGGLMPDFTFMYNFENFGRLIETEQTWAMTPELLQEYAPNVWSKMPEAIWKNVTGPDGLIHGIPFNVGAGSMREDMREMFDVSYFDFYDAPWITLRWTGGHPFYIRDDISKKLFPDMPGFEEAWAVVEETNQPIPEMFVYPIYSTEEFVKAYYDIKELGLTENNKPVYSFGYVQGDNWMALTALGGEMMGYKEMEYMSIYNATANKLEFGLKTPMVKEAARLQNQMILDSVIDPESIMHTIEVYREKFLNGQYGIVSGMGMAMAGYSIDMLNDELAAEGKEYRYIPFYTQVQQQADYPYMRRVSNSIGAQYLIPLKTMDEAKFHQWLNWLNVQFSAEWDFISQWGTEASGVYAVGDDGVPFFTDEKVQATVIGGGSDLDWKECFGLMRYNRATNLAFSINAYSNPFGQGFLSSATKKISMYDAFAKFSYASPFAANVPLVGNFQAWFPDFANLPQVTDMFNTRNVWEDAVKQAIAASDGQFEDKWANAMEVVDDSFDIEGLLTGQEPIFQDNQAAVKARGEVYQRTVAGN